MFLKINYFFIQKQLSFFKLISITMINKFHKIYIQNEKNNIKYRGNK